MNYISNLTKGLGKQKFLLLCALFTDLQKAYIGYQTMRLVERSQTVPSKPFLDGGLARTEAKKLTNKFVLDAFIKKSCNSRSHHESAKNIKVGARKNFARVTPYCNGWSLRLAAKMKNAM